MLVKPLFDNQAVELIIDLNDWTGASFLQAITPVQGWYEIWVLSYDKVDSAELRVLKTGIGMFPWTKATADVYMSQVGRMYFDGAQVLQCQIVGGTLGAASTDKAIIQVVKIQ